MTQLCRFSCCIVAAVVVSSAALPAQAAKTLRWKFREGESLQYEMQQRMEMKMSVAGQNINTKTDQTMDMTWTVKSIGEDGSCRMKQRIDRIRLTLDGPTGEVEYDSAATEQPNNALLNTIRPVFESLVGAEFMLTMDQLGRISDVQIPKEFQESVQKSPGQMQQMFNEDSMKQMLQQAALILPEKAVSTNDRWDSQMTFEMPFGQLTNDNQMTYLGTDESNRSLEKIRLTSNTTMQAKPNSPIKVELKDQQTSGTINFDNVAGRIEGSAITQKMVMGINAGGQAMQQTVTQTMRLRLKPNKTP